MNIHTALLYLHMQHAQQASATEGGAIALLKTAQTAAELRCWPEQQTDLLRRKLDRDHLVHIMDDLLQLHNVDVVIAQRSAPDL